MRNRILLLSFIVLLNIPVFGHAPKKIILDANLKNKTLSIQINHRVKDPEHHYIKLVKVFLNGQLIEEKEFLKQSGLKLEEITFSVDEMKRGDKLEVVCVCSISGEKKSMVEVKNEKVK